MDLVIAIVRTLATRFDKMLGHGYIDEVLVDLGEQITSIVDAVKAKLPVDKKATLRSVCVALNRAATVVRNTAPVWLLGRSLLCSVLGAWEVVSMFFDVYVSICAWRRVSQGVRGLCDGGFLLSLMHTSVCAWVHAI